MSKVFTEKDFLEHVDQVNSTNYVYGNEVLYKNFGFGVLPRPASVTKDTGKLWCAIWMIGKSYSADPTRSAGSLVSGSGLGLSFEAIAESIVNHEKYEELYKKLATLQGESFCYDFAKDKEILLECVSCVAMLNGMMKDSMGKDSDNVISFCSKLLHFLCPNVFFIYDSLSLAGGVSLYSGRADRVFKVETIPQTDWLEISDIARNYFKGNRDPRTVSVGKFANDEPTKVYLEHCLRAYALAVFLHEKKRSCALQIEGDPKSQYMPRLVDSILMRITRA